MSSRKRNVTVRRPSVRLSLRQILNVTHQGAARDVASVYFASLYICTISQKTMQRTTKLDTQMFHDESWKLVYFLVKRSKVKITRSVLVFVRECNITAAAYVSHVGFSLLQCPDAQAMLVTSGFPQRGFLHSRECRIPLELYKNLRQKYLHFSWRSPAKSPQPQFPVATAGRGPAAGVDSR